MTEETAQEMLELAHSLFERMISQQQAKVLRLAGERARRLVDEVVTELTRLGNVQIAIAEWASALELPPLNLRLANRMIELIIETGLLPEGGRYGHLPMKLYRWSEVEELLTRHGEVVSASAA